MQIAANQSNGENNFHCSHKILSENFAVALSCSTGEVTKVFQVILRANIFDRLPKCWIPNEENLTVAWAHVGDDVVQVGSLS